MKIKLFIICCFILTHIASAQSDSAFALCGTGVKWPYYNPDLTYYGNFRAIKKYYAQNYETEKFLKLENNSGIVRIQFVVNCKGESGNFVVESCDYNYKICNVNPLIVNSLLELTKSLNGWIPAINEQGESVNSHKFFAFKIVKGVIEDILPK
jgi:hypothetical protein